MEVNIAVSIKGRQLLVDAVRSLYMFISDWTTLKGTTWCRSLTNVLVFIKGRQTFFIPFFGDIKVLW